jgi:hypothetical protein
MNSNAPNRHVHAAHSPRVEVPPSRRDDSAGMSIVFVSTGPCDVGGGFTLTKSAVRDRQHRRTIMVDAWTPRPPTARERAALASREEAVRLAFVARLERFVALVALGASGIEEGVAW